MDTTQYLRSQLTQYCNFIFCQGLVEKHQFINFNWDVWVGCVSGSWKIAPANNNSSISSYSKAYPFWKVTSNKNTIMVDPDFMSRFFNICCFIPWNIVQYNMEPTRWLWYSNSKRLIWQSDSVSEIREKLPFDMKKYLPTTLMVGISN